MVLGTNVLYVQLICLIPKLSVAGRTKVNSLLSSLGELGRSDDISFKVILVISVIYQTLVDKGYGEYVLPNPLTVDFKVLLARKDSLILAFLCRSALNQSVPFGVASILLAPNTKPAESSTDKVVELVILLIILGSISSDWIITSSASTTASISILSKSFDDPTNIYPSKSDPALGVAVNSTTLPSKLNAVIISG